MVDVFRNMLERYLRLRRPERGHTLLNASLIVLVYVSVQVIHGSHVG